MSVAAVRTPLAEILADRIRATGPMTFADYMAACLYHPEFGYYAGAKSAERDDYYTSPALDPIFGKLIAYQLHEMWTLLDNPDPFLIVEGGAGDALLASHILDFAATRFYSFYPGLHYVAVETSPSRRAAAAARLERHISAGRAEILPEFPADIPVGVFLSNELFDAFPVHLVEHRGGALREIYVTCDERGALVESFGDLSSPEIEEYFDAQNVRFEIGQRAEAGLAAAHFMESRAQRLQRGFALTIDYGLESPEIYNAQHMRGTLLTYRRHRTSENFYAAPGEQDLTAHANFTALDQYARRAGLRRAGLTSQTNFLLAIARRYGLDDLGGPNMSHTQRLQQRLRFNTLVNPEAMGETFHVMIQQKGVPNPKLTGLLPL